jgi:hypothetical protein
MTMPRAVLALICLAAIGCNDPGPVDPSAFGVVEYVVTGGCCDGLPIDMCCGDVGSDPGSADPGSSDPGGGGDGADLHAAITYPDAVHGATTVHAKLPWRYRTTAAHGQVVSVSAVIDAAAPGAKAAQRTITVAIFKNGTLSQSQSMRGASIRAVSVSDLF